MEVSPVPYITVKATKCGSPIAASVCNALLYTDVKRNDMLFVEGKESNNIKPESCFSSFAIRVFTVYIFSE